MKTRLSYPMLDLWLGVFISVFVRATGAVQVTVDNFCRVESDLCMSNMVKDGSFGKFLHRREPAAIDNQTVIHPIRRQFSTSMIDE